MTTNCALTQHSSHTNEMTAAVIARTRPVEDQVIQNHSMKQGGTPAISRRAIGDCSSAGRGRFFPSGMQSLKGYPCASRHTRYTCMELSISKKEKTEHLLKTKMLNSEIVKT